MIVVGKVALMGDWDTRPVPDGCVDVRLIPSHFEGHGWDMPTRIMLQYLQDHIRPGEKVMDFGAGTGVLALAALALGAKQADAVEWQETIRDVATKNAKVNGVSLGVHRVAPAKKYGLVLCNLLGGDATRKALEVIVQRLAATSGKVILTNRAVDWEETKARAEELGLALVESAQANDDIRNGEWFIGVFTWPK